MLDKKIKVVLIKSTNNAKKPQKKIVKALGLNKINSYHIHKDNDAIRGMINKVKHLVQIENIERLNKE